MTKISLEEKGVCLIYNSRETAVHHDGESLTAGAGSQAWKSGSRNIMFHPHTEQTQRTGSGPVYKTSKPARKDVLGPVRLTS